MPAVNFVSRRAYVQHVPDTVFHDQSLYRSLLGSWERGRTGNNRGDYSRLLFFMATLRTIRDHDIRGEIAELGVFRGNTANLFHRMLPDRKVYLLDTFGGFSDADTVGDPSGAGEGAYASDLHEVKAFLSDSPKLVYCPGRFPETSHMIDPDDTFALVHLDCDLYKPTRAALELFYPRMAPGGFIVCHDYDGTSWPGVTRAVDEFFADKVEGPVIIPDKSGSAVVRIAAARP